MSKKVLGKGNPSATFIKIVLENKNLLAYIDTGATLCFGRKSISRNWDRLEKPKEIVVADKSKHQIWFSLKDVSIEIEGYKFFIPTIYLHDSGLDLIIGNNFLKLYEPFIQRSNTISLRWKNLGNPDEKKMITTKIITRNEILKMISGNLKKLSSIWEEYKFFSTLEERLDEVCSDDPLDNQKNTNHELIVIRLKNSNEEVNVPNRIPYTIKDVEEFKTECKDLLEKGLIRPSSSPHSAPAFYVENHNEIKRGKRRMVINYKKLNLATIGDSYGLPRKDFIFEKIKGCNYFSSLDAKSGYYQLRLSDETKPLTAFSCPPQKHFEWNVLPFGLKQAPSIYQRFMDNSLQGLDHICLAYIDDILIFTKGTKEQHIKDVEIVLLRIKEKGIVISKKKSQLCKTEIEYLGVIIKDNGELNLAPHTQEKISAFPDVLVDRKQIQRFLGCLNYIANEGFFKDLAKERKILQRKISEKIPWSWTDEDTKIVKTIKSKIQVLPKLYNPTNDDFLVVEIDASKDTWAGCMRAFPNGKATLKLNEFGENLSVTSDIQSDLISKERKTDKKQNLVDYSAKFNIKEKELLLCKYISGTFSDTETRYPIAELETLACVRVLEKWRVELLPSRFLLRTDSKYLTGFWRYNIKADYKSGRLIRWQMKLQQFQPYIQYIKSENNSFADTLTREWSKQ
ncbi:unnamed protein product [Trifolium pratense]|uniref:Uncharacterized protein n=1 Tax=Trifolium pratense TaxID=57577 RepID=A0ACB0JR08_TRIPR|nr:unnamed protein product [Trifolium pratense]